MSRMRQRSTNSDSTKINKEYQTIFEDSKVAQPTYDKPPSPDTINRPRQAAVAFNPPEPEYPWFIWLVFMGAPPEPLNKKGSKKYY